MLIKKFDLYQWKEADNYKIKPNIYIVKSGDSFKKISKKFDVSVEKLKKINNVNKLYPGLKLFIEK